ncbi:hypothetical protein [Radicibacter daui]|uniref:hypothetical protein n=1 Tax=Radicibacter daui TaxID=3064829 RepID=UPI004046FBD6
MKREIFSGLYFWGLLILIVAALWITLGFAPELCAVKSREACTVLRPWIWAGLVAALTLLFAFAGQGLTGRWGGILIDSRNKISLSRFQMAGWSIVVLGSVFSAALCNIAGLGIEAGSYKGPLDFDIDANLLGAIGIAGISLVSAPVILNAKSTRPQAPAAAKNQAIDQLGADPGDMTEKGQIFGWRDPSLARWTDLFRSDDTAGAATVDLAKVQQFAVTLLLLGVYSADMLVTLHGADLISELPKLSPGFVWLLGVSHGSYLVAKANPLAAPTAPAQPQDTPANS